MNSNLEICSFPDGKSAMLALTFDDGTLDHLEIAAPELEKRGWRGTFYINPQSNDRACSRRLNWDGIRELHRRGHEIGNHSMSHSNPQRLAQEKQFETLAWEIAETQRQIFEHTGTRPVTYTAPYGAKEEFVSRLLAANNLLETPRRVYIGENTTPEDFAKIHEQSVQPGTFTVIMFHGVAPGYGGWAPVASKEFFSSMLDAWMESERELHVGTFAETGSYAERIKHVSLEEIAPDAFLLSLAPEAAHLYGPVFLRSTEQQKRIRVNTLPVVPRKNGVFRVYPGSVIALG